MERVLLTEEEASLRLDKALSVKFPNYSRSFFQKLIDQKNVSVQGRIVKKKDRLLQGDEILVRFPPKQESLLLAEDIPLDILYEDEHLIALNKPRGMVVHPAAGNLSHTVVNALLYHRKSLPTASSPVRPGIVHRLDKPTSGLLLVAKTEACLERLIDLFRRREIKKEYLAICERPPKQEGLISFPIGRHPKKRKKMQVQQGGKEAFTEIVSIKKLSKGFLVLAKPITGRTHQIRVHLKALFSPIVGDRLYGGAVAPHLLLHAHTLTFLHPFSKKSLFLVSPPPTEFLF